MEGLRACYERLAVGGTDQPAQKDVALAYSDRLVELLDNEFDDLIGMRQTLEDACAVNGDNLKRLARLESCVTRMEDWHGLGDVKDRQIAVAGDGSLKLDLLRELADLSENRLGNFEHDAWMGMSPASPRARCSVGHDSALWRH